MLLLQLCLISLIVFADLTESKVYLLRDYEDEPAYINKEKSILSQSPAVISKHKILGNSRHLKSKRGKHARQAVIHYGRHIYHLDSFEDLSKLRSPKSPDYISKDYFDINNLIRTKPTLRDIPWDYVDDILYLSHKPKKKKCKGKRCEENLRKYSKMYHKHRKHKDDDDDDRRKKLDERRLRLGTLTRFQIIDNTKRKKKYSQRYESSEERTHVRRRPKRKHRRKKKYTSASSSEEKKLNSASESAESWEKKKKKMYGSSEEASIYKKKKYSSESNSRSHERSLVPDSSSNSIEKSFQKMKKKKKVKAPAEERKTIDNEEMYLQGNKLITPADNEEDNNDKRRRLPQFMPKRYHWDPDDIHDLGYYWFNGPKGKYSEPKSVAF